MIVITRCKADVVKGSPLKKLKLFFLFISCKLTTAITIQATMSSHDADLNLKEAQKKLAAASRVVNAALENEKQAKQCVKIAQKAAKEAHKKETKLNKPAKSKSPTQVAYQLFGDNLRKNGEKISMKRQGELWKSADQAYWILQTRQINQVV